MDLGKKETEITDRIISDFAGSIELYEDYFDLLPENVCSAITSFLKEPDAAGLESICEELYITGVNYHTCCSPDYFGDNVRSDLEDGNIEVDELYDIVSLLNELSYLASTVNGRGSAAAFGAERLEKELDKILRDEETRRRER